ncbi:ATP-dependent DNA helicase RecG [Ruminococcus difficilis]|uniref:ATP-dependent DNA helicase RecG n=1 Tax=Ruminococcus difficilis TaxID=2763069 RepID=A0A934WUW7_9FIRM|nr:ATP-dependent DNA helicase RecG [Ruminococcus difficilis]MBK6090351.1 ATP-dependent DNA helicase RecG [Ruminococcus difficilis]
MSLYEVPITKLSGIGEKRAALFRKLGIETVGDMISYYPRSYENWSDTTDIGNVQPEEKCVVRGKVMTPVNTIRISGGRTMAKLSISDDTGYLNLVFFNNKYISSMLRYGETYLFMGKVAYDKYGYQMVSPEFCKVTEGDTITPVYHLTAGLNNHMMIRAAKEALSMLPQTIHDPLPDDIRKRYDLCNLSYALNNVHFPTDLNAMEKARHRLIFEELLVLNLGMRMMKSQSHEQTAVHLLEDHTAEFIQTLPYELTNAQKRAISDCVADMRDKPSPMNRLIQGDVGSGKTAVCAAVCYHTVKNGFQAAFMAPTEILAQQHFETFSAMFADTDVRVELLTGSMTAAEKRKTRERIECGESDIVIGTHALVSESTAFCRLGCAITDEQHRFGVAQRARLASKGEHPHVLVLSATPIPRTLGLIIYGDLDITVIDELPPGRTEVDTFFIRTDKRDRALGFLKKQVEEGRQCYIVCPLVEESEGVDELQNATDYAAELMLGPFRDISVGILHGKMKPKDKEKVMAQFAANEISILVSTTVVEVGVDVKNATVMMIENADRFGLSTLHQLRGRVGRGQYKSYCILVSDNKGENTEQRLGVMCRTNNGFEIADMDLKLRGPGDFFGNRQHGLPQLDIADFSDTETLAQSQEAAQTLLRFSPDLSDGSLRALRAKMRRLFAETENTMN